MEQEELALYVKSEQTTVIIGFGLSAVFWFMLEMKAANRQDLHHLSNPRLTPSFMTGRNLTVFHWISDGQSFYGNGNYIILPPLL
nr:MAG TPA: hypothetical protein [Caudoviricetes sp.]